MFISPSRQEQAVFHCYYTTFYEKMQILQRNRLPLFYTQVGTFAFFYFVDQFYPHLRNIVLIGRALAIFEDADARTVVFGGFHGYITSQ
jgi:hypothetical protein